jgi:CRP-like cAMP-binding protein
MSTIANQKPKRPATLKDFENIELFAEVGESSLRLLLGNSIICNLDAQERLFPTRNEVDYLYVIIMGYVGIWLTSSFDPTVENFLAWRGPGQIIGEMRVIGDARSEARITTCQPCTLIEVRSDTFTDVADGNARIYRNISRLLMKKMYQERHRSEVIQTSTAAQKIAKTLLHLAEERIGKRLRRSAEALVIPGLIIQDEIGAYIGVKRETVNRQLSELKRRNVITYKKSKKGSEITILNYERLLEISSLRSA